MKMRLFLTLAVISVLLTGLLVATAGAQTSDNYAAEQVLTTSNGGGQAASDNYAVHLTVGQPATGTSASSNYSVGVGFWYGAVAEEQIFGDGFESGDMTEWSITVP